MSKKKSKNQKQTIQSYKTKAWANAWLPAWESPPKQRQKAKSDKNVES